MRLAIAISFWALSAPWAVLWGGEPFAPITLAFGPRPGYLVSEEYANQHKAELVASIPGEVKVERFWTPSDADVAVAERLFRELLHRGEKFPELLFPDLSPDADSSTTDSVEHEQRELLLVDRNYDAYARQYVGVIIEGQKLVFCNYSDAPGIDPSKDYIYMEKSFAVDGSVHFLQCRVNAHDKTCTNVAMVGSWLPKAL